MEGLEKEVLDFFKKRVSRKLTIESYLTDYCKDEDDAFFLLIEFFEKYTISEGYLDIDKYFYNTKTYFGIHFGEKTEGKPSISIRHLVETARFRKWINP
ncbi:hypothetical protein AV926_01920 [Myroides marinus]|jgi:hypothetical protein|uniref:DUF1493 family protein n=1 Tax=Myroides marinus TaxID=703342 RepID=A0A163VWV4_9FLAO|nr:DUF1493 family protein [Myroides marinus]KUF37810.1 hypothetical protein AS361_11785 [Myroides marinus]KZE75518.1 hypothetical protein AV926_01920 [Myroides marinus]MDM1360246.1 DUF1493 family protein [Myroides marinus]